MVDENEVLKIARLGRLKLGEGELKKYTSELNSILDYVTQLRKVDVSKVEGMSHVHGSTNIFREDAVEPPMALEDALKNTPDVIGRFIRVPLIVE